MIYFTLLEITINMYKIIYIYIYQVILRISRDK